MKRTAGASREVRRGSQADDDYRELIREYRRRIDDIARRLGERPPETCGFCGRDQDEVAELILGQAAYICDECVMVCHEIVARGSSASGDR